MKKFLSLVLALVMTMSLVTISAGAKDFTDDSTIDYDVAVQVMSEVKVVEGYPDGSFNPTKTLTRAEAAKIICNMILGPTTAGALKADTAPFTDVPTSHWASGYIAYCAQQGIIGGYGNGKFGVNDNLDGYSYMKMLLCALGYDAEIEGFVGANWSIAVAKRALGVGLDDGNDEFNGSAAVTREEACLYAFNTLQADLVEYDGKTTISVGGTNVTVGASSAKAVTTTNRTDGTRIGKDSGPDYVLQFGEKYFTKLSRSATIFDKQGRPSYNWRVSNRLVATENKTATVVYTTGEKAKDVYKDLDLDQTTYLYYFVDGVCDPDRDLFTLNSTSETKVCGSKDGKILEIYIDDNGPDYAVVINPKIVKITSVGSDDDGRYVKTEGGYKFYTEEFAKNDYVEVFFGNDGNTIITEMKAAEMQTGKVTKLTGDDYTIDGTKYSKSGSQNKDVNGGKGDVIDFWLDSNGYILRSKVSESSINVNEMAFVLSAGNERGNWARLLLSDGTKKTVDTDKNYDSSPDLKKKIISFDVDGSEYELQDKTTYYGDGVYYFDKGTTTINGPTLADKVSVDSKTVFVITDHTDGYSAKSYVGYKNAPSFDNAVSIATFVKPNETAAALVYVFVADNNVTGDTSDIVFFIPKSGGYDVTHEVDKLSYYTVPAIVNGEYKKLDVKAGSNADVDGVSWYVTKSITAYKGLKVNSDGQVTDVVPADNFVYLDENVSNQAEALKNDVVTLGGVTLAYNDKTNVYFVADDRKSIETGTIEDILDDDNDTSEGTNPYHSILYTVDKDNTDVLTNVVLIRNK